MSNQFSILAVDDEPFNLDLIELAFSGIEEIIVHCVANGREALDFLQQDPAVHVILLDLAMPVMDGFTTMEALAADSVLRKIPVIVVTANTDEKNRALKLGASDFLFKPVDVEELKLRVFNHARTKGYQDELEQVNDVLENKVRERTKALQIALDAAVSAEREISFRLGRAAEFRDLETGAHIKRMSYYSTKLAELAKLDEQDVVTILHGSPLHDIGKVGIPDQILLKPGKLNDEEFEIMKQHTIIGGHILEDAEGYPVIQAGRIISEQHHEKFDGSGYPLGLKGEEIHIFGRIGAIADVFDALSSRRVYKPAFPLERTMAIMNEGSGRHFDPFLYELFRKNLNDFLEIMGRFPDKDDEHQNILSLIEGRG